MKKLELWVICDKCELKHDAMTRPALVFMRNHADHVFNGLRIMRKDFPCPNRQKDYKEVWEDAKC